MAADDDLDALEAQLEDYDDDDDDDDLPPLKRVWKKFKILIVMGVALIIFIPVILMSISGPDTLDDRRVVVVPELAPEPGKQAKVTPETPAGKQESGQEQAVYNMVAEGENAGKIAITAPPEDPKAPPANAKAPEGGETAIAMVPEGVEKTPKDGESTEGAMVPPVMPPPMPPEKEGEVTLPALPAPGAPTVVETVAVDPKVGDGKTTENILPGAPTTPAAIEPKPAAPMVAEKMPAKPPATVALVQPAQPVAPPAAPKAPASNTQVAVVIPKVTKTIATPPPPTPSGKMTATPMRTMAGVYRVQVASTRTESSAKTIWNKQVNKYPDVLGKLPLTVQSAVIQDRGTFYRVQGGAFGDREAADSICRKLKSRGQDCLVVRP
jgi:hypothetical protein